MYRFALALIAAACLVPASAQAQVSATADVAFRSRYLFAGMVFWEGAMTQPKLTVSATSGNGTFTANGGLVYMHGDSDAVLETDVWGDYYHQINDAVGVYVGAGYYSFKDFITAGEFSGTPEVYGGLVLYVPLQPSVYVARDFDLTEGSHVTFSLTHSVAVAESGASLTFLGRLDYNREYYRTVSGFAFADVTATLALPVGPLTLNPMFTLQAGLDDDDLFGDWAVFGVSASMGF